MARATTRRARNGWLSARLFATLAMVFATLSDAEAAAGASTACTSSSTSATASMRRRPTLERPGSLGAARAERQTLEPSARGSLATRSRPTRGLFQRSPSPSDSTSLSSWPKSDVDATQTESPMKTRR